MVLGQLPVAGRPTVWITVGQGPTALAVSAGGGCLDIFTLTYPFSPLSPSLGDGPIYTEILSQRAVKPKTSNQPTKSRILLVWQIHNSYATNVMRFSAVVLSRTYMSSETYTLY